MKPSMVDTLLELVQGGVRGDIHVTGEDWMRLLAEVIRSSPLYYRHHHPTWWVKDPSSPHLILPLTIAGVQVRVLADERTIQLARLKP